MTSKTQQNGNPEETHRSATAWLLLPLALFPLVALLTYDWHAIRALATPAIPSTNWIGPLGDTFAYYGYLLFGLAIWVVPLISIFFAIQLVTRQPVFCKRSAIWSLLTIVSLAGVFQTAGQNPGAIASIVAHLNIADAGGVVGYLFVSRLLTPLVSPFGAIVITLILLLVSLVATIGAHNLLRFSRAIFHWAIGLRRDASASNAEEAEDDPLAAQQEAYLAALKAKADAKHQQDVERQNALKRLRESQHPAPAPVPAPTPASVAPPKPVAPPSPAPKPPATTKSEPLAENKGPYELPTLALLNPLTKSSADHGNITALSQKLIDTLKLFNVNAELAYTVEGPVVTKYALIPEPGTKPEKFLGLQNTLMMALKAKSLRIEAPIPGEDKIGIEVPNVKPAGVSFREIFESEEWQGSTAELPLLFGKKANGEVLIADLASMPHMLVAGATGQGKSVCLNSLICGLLMTRTPEQLKLIMVDPKSVEFTPYASIPHLLVPVITENQKVVFALRWAVNEMEKRLKLFSRAKVKNIYDFNHRSTFTQTDMFGNDTEIGSDMPRTVPYIVIIIDEAADLIGQCGKDVNPNIQRITQKARAAGIHLILATQRPDAKIITGTIKANIPGRVAFKTSQAIDSRTILDESGAENLIGRGDMLFRGKDNLLIRAQGAWISDEEIMRVTQFIEQHSNTQFDDRFTNKLKTIKDEEDDLYGENDNGDDKASAAEQRATVKAAADADLYKRAIEVIINTNRASVSHFQRKLTIGYNHAARLCDELEENGVIGPQQSGAGPRPIIMNQDELLAIFNGGAGDNPAAEGAPLSDTDNEPQEASS